MAEIGLVRFARLTLEVSEAVLPAQQTKFSKRQFSQPQLLAVLCLMRYEDWTFREAEVRLGEHSELRSALHLNSVPDHTTLYRFLTRLSEDDVARVLREIVRRMPGKRRSPATVAVGCDWVGTGCSQQLFHPPDRTFWRKATQLEALAEMAHGSRCRAADHPGAERPAGTME